MDIQILAPVAREDYPRNWTEFLDWFGTEEACLSYLERLRWPGGFICPSCASAGTPYRSSRSRLMCRDCARQSTVTAGTLFDKTRTPLRVWLAAAWYLTNQKQGVSALGLQRVLGLGSYKTAWAMLHRFRRAMVRPGRDRLKGHVEVDETYLAISDRQEPISPVGRKSSTDKVLVVIAVEMLEPKGFGRIRLRRIADDSASCVIPFVQEAVEPGAEVRTDGSAAYLSLGKLGYEHRRTVIPLSDVPAHVSMAGVHRVASLIKRWILGTHHGAVEPEHLDAYLDEFVFRFNRRTSASRGMLFYRLLQQAVVTEPVTYEDVVRKGPTPMRRKNILDAHPVIPT
ncbi:MAG: IS1595 family transposase [Pseudomonadota bacterium]|nr:IS1595 family transposase [Pseudomonadota bacterium]